MDEKSITKCAPGGKHFRVQTFNDVLWASETATKKHKETRGHFTKTLWALDLIKKHVYYSNFILMIQSGHNFAHVTISPSAVVACAKLWFDWTICGYIRATCIFTIFISWYHEPFVKRVSRSFLGLYSLNDMTSYHKISQKLEVAIYGFRFVQVICNMTSFYVVMLLMHRRNFRALQ